MSPLDYLTAGVLTIVGGFLLQLPLGTVVSFGNLMPYMVSYLRNRVPSQVGGGAARIAQDSDMKYTIGPTCQDHQKHL